MSPPSTAPPKCWIRRGPISPISSPPAASQFVEADALGFLRGLPDASLDVVSSNYAVHNFLDDYRREFLTEIFRVLKPGGLFVNGDRYAMDDRAAHLSATQAEVRSWFAKARDDRPL